MEEKTAPKRAHNAEKTLESKIPGEVPPNVSGLPLMTVRPGPFARWDDPVPPIRGDAIAAPFTPPRMREIPRDGDTEDLLNGLIAECHFLMREVSLPTAIQVLDATTRAQFLNTAMSLAQTGAKVGRTVAKLRGAGAVTEIRQRHISERVTTGPAPQIENGAKT